MKKLALIAAMVCFVLATAAALDFTPSVAVSGSATAKVGFNLDTSIIALKNEFGAGVTVKLIPKATEEKSGEGNYGYIKLADFQVLIDDSNAWTIDKAKVTAKLVFGPMFLQFMDESNATKAISVGRFGLANITDGKLLLTATKYPAEAPVGSYFYAGYDSEMIDVTLKASSTNDYCTDAEGTDLTWFFAPKVSVSVAGATIAAGAEFATVDQFFTTSTTTTTVAGDNPDTNVVETEYDVTTTTQVANDFFTGLGASASYSMALTDKITLAPSVGFDVTLADDTIWAFGGGVFAKWGGNDEYDAYMNLTQGTTCTNTYATGDDIKYQGGAGVSFQVVNDPALADMTINAIAQVNEQRGDDGLVPGLGAALGLYLANVTAANNTDMVMKFGAFANYKVGDITPFVRAVYTAEANGVEASAIFGLGADVANILPNTKLTLDYNSWNVLGDNTKGVFSAAVKVSF